MISEWLGLVLAVLAIPFFLGGSVGLLRFPDFYTRVHALTKADNLGLGLIVMARLVQADSWNVGFKLLLIWCLILMSSATTAYLMARSERTKGTVPWSKT
jgi:multicomponent Na+:H+ antiporter subunit G